jgi:hypothetical protein
MQPAPKGRDARIVVDPRPGTGGKGIMIPKPNPKAKKKPGTGRVYPNPGMGNGGRVDVQPIDNRVYRTMPITEKQLKSIKNMYGFKG